MVLATVRGQLRPSPGTDGGDSAEPPSLVVLWSLARTLSPRTTLPNRRALLGASTGVWSRGTLTQRPMPSTAMADTALALVMEVMEAMAPTATVRGQLRPSPGTDGGDSAEPPSPAVPLSLDRTLSPRTTLPNRRALLGASTGASSRGTLTQRPMPTMA